MQLLTLAGIFFLVAYSVAAPGAERVGPCEKARQDAGQSMPGKFIPQCTQYGFFMPTQCHGSTGKCWCVVPDTGKEIEGTSTFRTGAPECSICHAKRAEALRPAGIVGNFVPECDADGQFKSTQHWGSTGQTWCVDRITGTEIQGTRSGPSQRPVTCSAVSASGACFKELQEKLARKPVLGAELPQCSENGDYVPEQRGEGYRWCANPKTGAVEGKKYPPGDNTPLPCVNNGNNFKVDGACFKELEEKLARKPVLGAELPQCNNENGDYIPVQFREGYRWCANPKTGAVEGKKYPPGDNTPLPCVNNGKAEGACFKELQEKLARKPVLGADLPQCNNENGDYIPVQRREGYSWCANPKTGAVEGKKYPPGDNTPLPCVNN